MNYGNRIAKYEYLSVNEYNVGGGVKTANYVENRNKPLLGDIQDYRLQVVSFSLPTINIPLFNYKSPTPGTFLGTFSLEYYDVANIVGGQAFFLQQDVVLTRGGQYPPLPAPPISLTSPITFSNSNGPEYDQYNLSPSAVFNIDIFVKAMNFALELLAIQLNSDPRVIVPVGLTAPVILFNSSTGIFSMKFPATYAYGDPASAFNLYCNLFIADLLDGIPNFFVTESTQPAREVLFNVFNTGDNVSGGFYTMTSCYSSLNHWIRVRKILLISNSMRINPESLTSNLNTTKKDLIGNIIAEFNIGAFNRLEEFYSPITYVQYNDEQNSIVFNGTGALYDLDFTFVYEDIDGQIWPILLSKGQGFNLKLKFTKYK